ncbi:MBL fold metallo-hydrolase [Nocardia sp. 852002-20019_SCH5090214]|jgi:glyoxylase-like metal-dependent hydrolase (beta-lactamase superfamily II)|uniref:MBL fold metallo-hydrolase n=1 Tax=Nocardia TaxID=1817 RepID=UPI0007A485C3|nr:MULTISPECIES: MBL fold metallo-hydrolase [Nocardia]OBF73838.1 MBL fold metallo-hydrolase [Mycobacterium sp. 852002-51759_SCH5129042]MBF6273825.1 MBL fold metallo-hydrolase [Nocardia nova]MBV7706090.1 MBL fold metallo-hydrolase [Nocardia nova]OBA43497.1 MBL fold metallo-hydrolase [Nocardia sp. 852002-51101_SCH5132738]OBA52934.1 MBL fold metallo-hydrolase [Nocardia sp. 852002-20019_SCH5090214]
MSAIEQVADSVYVVAGTNVNWSLITGDSGVVLVDAGYPRDTGAVLDSLRRIGHEPADLVAILLTHAHLDHIGAIPTLVERTGVPVYTGADEAAHARREYLQQITPVDMARQLGTPGGPRWVFQTLRALGGHVRMSVPTATSYDENTLRQLPGGIVAVPTPGHTTGHTAYLMPDEGILFSGDALVTGHPLLPDTGLQALPEVFNHDETQTHTTAESLIAHRPRLLIPGHGKPMAR